MKVQQKPTSRCYLGLDVSTAVVGVCVLDCAANIIELTHIDLRKINGTWKKADAVKNELLSLRDCLRASLHGCSDDYVNPILHTFVERNLSGFRMGFSSSKTLMSLGKFNGIVSFLAREVFSVDPIDIDASEARRIVGIRYSRDDPRQTKEKIWECVSKLIQHEWRYRIVMRGKKKGQRILDETNFDEADAWVIARAGLLSRA